MNNRGDEVRVAGAATERRSPALIPAPISVVVTALLLATMSLLAVPNQSQAEDEIPVRATDFSIVADFSYKISGNEVSFTDKSHGIIVNWTWAFGDRCLSFEQNPVHRYNTTGSVQVTLRVVDLNEFSCQKAVWIKLGAYDTMGLTVICGILITMGGVVWTMRADEGFKKIAGIVVVIVGLAFLASLATQQDMLARILELIGFTG